MLDDTFHPWRGHWARTVAVAYVLAVGAALANALTTILQRLGVEQAPAEHTLRLSLLAYALRRKVWLAGFGVMVAAFLLQASALHFGTLTAVQPILTLELPFLVAILGLWFHRRVGWREWGGSLAAAGGLAAFLALAAPVPGGETPNLHDWGIVSFAVVLSTGIAVVLAQVGSAPAWRAAWFGVSGAIMFAFTASLIKQATADGSHQWFQLFLHWHAYAMAAAGLMGMFLTQNAFQVGPVTASQSMLVIVDPLASIAIGIGLFGDRLETAGVRGPLEASGLLVLMVGVFALARSPLVRSVKQEPDAAGDPELGPTPQVAWPAPAPADRRTL